MKKITFKIAFGLVVAAHSLGVALAKTPGSAAGDAAPATVAYDHCSWNRPGVNPFMGDVVAAVDRYRDIPPEVRARLKARMEKREYDDLVSIRRDAITGRGGYEYGTAINEMHFGTNQLCHTVTRAAWTPQMEERGLVYCESGTCILVPTVCRNVSRISRRGVGNDVAEGLPPFLPTGAGYPAGDEVPPALPLAEALPLDGYPAPAAGVPLDGGPIGDAPGVGWAGPVAAGGGGFIGIGGAGGGAFASGGGGGGGSSSVVAPPSGSASGDDGIGAPLAPVPEPETWALMLGGVVTLMFLQRRTARRRSAGR